MTHTKHRTICDVGYFNVSSWFILARCQCTSDYNIIIRGEFVGAYCSAWGSRDNQPWCFVRGGLQAANCPGAIKSDYGDFFYSSHAEVCRPAGNKELSSYM